MLCQEFAKTLPGSCQNSPLLCSQEGARPANAPGLAPSAKRGTSLKMASTFSSSSSSYNRPNARRQRARITSEQVQQLRNTGSHKICPVQKFTATFSENVKNVFAALFAPKVEKVHAMCKYYGHVIEGSWAGHTPKCLDCGTKVTAPEMLRKANPNPAVVPTCTAR